MADHDAGMAGVQPSPDLDHIRQLVGGDLFRWADCRLISSWVGWQSPAHFLRFLDTINLDNPYELMAPEEVHRLMDGEPKFVRLLILYARRYLEKRCRIRRKNSYLYYVSRSNYWLVLPRWVQDLDHEEWDRPSKDFFIVAFHSWRNIVNNRRTNEISLWESCNFCSSSIK